MPHVQLDAQGKPYSMPHYTVEECAAANRTDPRVHNDEYLCCWVAPFGFVPEAGCPKHDVVGVACDGP